MKTTALCLIVLLALPGTLIAQEPTRRPPQNSTRPDGRGRQPVGQLRISSQVFVTEDAPDFELTNANGHQVKLSQLRGRRVLLCFSDHRVRLAPFRAAAETLATMDVKLVGVCHDSPQSLRTLALRDSLPFELLSDSTGEIAALYGAFDFSTTSILAGYALVDRRGKVRMILLGQELEPEQLVSLTRYALATL
jgi:peroxiredoxin Q/BCP